LREELEKIRGVRTRFRGHFERFGHRTSSGYVKHMALLKDVTDLKGNEMCDHVWLNLTKQVEALHLVPGDVIEFDARVKPYWKGYHDDRRRDYRLSNPTKFVKLGVHETDGDGILFADLKQGSSTQNVLGETSAERNL